MNQDLLHCRQCAKCSPNMRCQMYFCSFNTLAHLSPPHLLFVPFPLFSNPENGKRSMDKNMDGQMWVSPAICYLRQQLQLALLMGLLWELVTLFIVYVDLIGSTVLLNPSHQSMPSNTRLHPFLKSKDLATIMHVSVASRRIDDCSAHCTRLSLKAIWKLQPTHSSLVWMRPEHATNFQATAQGVTFPIIVREPIGES